MSKERWIPQAQAERTDDEARRARFTAYAMRMRNIGRNTKADMESRRKAARIGGRMS